MINRESSTRSGNLQRNFEVLDRLGKRLKLEDARGVLESAKRRRKIVGSRLIKLTMFPRVKYKTKPELIKIFENGKWRFEHINPIPSYDDKEKIIYLIPNENTIRQIDSLIHELIHYFIDVISLNSICEECTEKLQLWLDHIDCWLYNLKEAKKYA